MLTEIDDLIRPDHYHLDGQDECYFIGEYTAGRGFSYSSTRTYCTTLRKTIMKQAI